MINVDDKKNCCGCTACKNICPVSCIRMGTDDEGFIYPSVDKVKCINCGACERACPIINYKRRVSFQESAYLLQNKDKNVLQESTSGGAFTAIALYTLRHGGIVYGAVMDSTSYKIHHAAIEDEADLYKLRNSKYVQSDIDSCYRLVLSQVESNRLVCFSGTPCQIEGLISFLGNGFNKYRDNLILVDVVCRAVPSPGVWRLFIHSLNEHHGEVTSVKFRDKELGYQYSTMLIETKNGNIQREGIETSLWLRMFFSGMIIRPSCSDCRFRSPYRKSDITLWDCFPSYRFDKKIDENAGTTRVLVHTTYGKKVIEEINNYVNMEEVPVDKAIESVREMRLSPQLNTDRKSFFDTLNCEGFDIAAKQFFPNSVKTKAKKITRRALNKMGIDTKIKHFIKKG